ncbi:MAG: hypothetical protein JKY54_19200 [Flavobacteriales bacterium]|nr:hypothetical protein [Flavobacteriales bacterium]
MRSGVIILLFAINVCFAQEELGILHSNYASTNTIEINPANGVLSKQYLDINLLGIHAYANNSLVYLNRSSFTVGGLINGTQEEVSPLYNLTQKRNSALGLAKISGLGAVLSVGDHSFGIKLNAKAFADGRNVPSQAAEYLVNDQIPTAGTYTHENIKAGYLSYAEIQGHYSRNIIKRDVHLVSAGVNLGYLIGIGGASFKINEGTFTVYDQENGELNSLNGEYMYLGPAWNSGKGFSASLGAVYSRMEESIDGYFHNSPKSGCENIDYKWRFGASLIDLGWVNFKNNALYRNFNETTGGAGDEAFESVDVQSWDAEIANRTTDANQKVWSRSKVYLPGALSLQGDYKFTELFRVGATYTHGFSKGQYRFGVQRAKLLSLTPRLETKRFEFAMPISLYEWRKPQLGAMLRLNNNLIIGSDKLGSFFGRNEIYGADLYVYVKFGLNRNPRCSTKDPGYKEQKLRSNGKSRGNTKNRGKRAKTGKSNKYSCPKF